MRFATIFVVLFGLPTLASAQAGPCAPLPYAFDPYKPSDLAVLRQFGSSVLANAPLTSLLQLDPYVPTQAQLLRQYRRRPAAVAIRVVSGVFPAWVSTRLQPC